MTIERSGVAMITGIGCVSPFGVGGHGFVADVLAANVSAIRPIEHFATAGLSRHLGAVVPEVHLPRPEEARRWSRMSLMTVAACRQAVADAGLHDEAALAPLGMVLGTGYGDLQSTEAFYLGFLRRGAPGLSALLFPNTVMNAMVGTASLALGLKGPLLTVNQPGVAGEVAVARAVALMRAGRVPAVIACGVDELFPMLYTTLAELNLLSPQDGGEEACRPFDRRHNGPILGEGATAVVLETPEHARARRAPVLATVYSAHWAGQRTHPYHYPIPHQVDCRIVERVLASAALPPGAIDVAYLSGCGDPQHDAIELALLAPVCSATTPVLTSVTHLTGDYNGLGAFRVAAATTTVRGGVLPRLDYLQQPMRSDLCFATPATCPVVRPTVLVHGIARGGTQVALVLGPAP